MLIMKALSVKIYGIQYIFQKRVKLETKELNAQFKYVDKYNKNNKEEKI